MPTLTRFNEITFRPTVFYIGLTVERLRTCHRGIEKYIVTCFLAERTVRV